MSQVSICKIDFREPQIQLMIFYKNKDFKPAKPFMKWLENMTWSVAQSLI